MDEPVKVPELYHLSDPLRHNFPDGAMHQQEKRVGSEFHSHISTFDAEVCIMFSIYVIFRL